MPLLYSIIYVAVLGILAHFIGEALPRSLFDPEKFPFKQFKFEKNGKLYAFLRVRKWKDKLPDASRFLRDMMPKKVSHSTNSAELVKLAKETCVAETVHRCLNFFYLGIYLFWKNRIGVALSALAIILNTPFIFIQRFNRPKLVALAQKLSKKEEKSYASINTVV